MRHEYSVLSNKLQDAFVDHVCFSHYGAKCHIAHETLKLLYGHCSGHILPLFNKVGLLGRFTEV